MGNIVSGAIRTIPRLPYFIDKERALPALHVMVKRDIEVYVSSHKAFFGKKVAFVCVNARKKLFAEDFSDKIQELFYFSGIAIQKLFVKYSLLLASNCTNRFHVRIQSQ